MSFQGHACHAVRAMAPCEMTKINHNVGLSLECVGGLDGGYSCPVCVASQKLVEFSVIYRLLSLSLSF